jgi:hypothetical protein
MFFECSRNLVFMRKLDALSFKVMHVDERIHIIVVPVL